MTTALQTQVAAQWLGQHVGLTPCSAINGMTRDGLETLRCVKPVGELVARRS